MNTPIHERDPQRPARRPRHDREDSRQERERDYVKEVQMPRKEKGQARAHAVH